jgi:signal peptidase I
VKLKKFLKDAWNFIWHSDSLISWVISFILAFLIVKYVIYVGLGLLFGTGFPIVAVVSGSMEHDGLDFDSWWNENSKWYESNDISLEMFNEFDFKRGFNKGDIMVLFGVEAKNINKGDILVFEANSKYPVIHRVVKVWSEDEEIYFQTKGDNNPRVFSELGENKIAEDRIIGKAVLRIPFLGWVKIMFTELIK